MKKPLLYYVLIKDLSIWILYFLLLRFNLTGETYTTSMTANFPGASRMDGLSMLAAAIYISWLPLLVDALLLTPFNAFVNKLNGKWLWSLCIGVLFHLPIFFFWKMAAGSMRWFSLNKASNTSLLLSFLVAALTMVVVQKAHQKAFN